MTYPFAAGQKVTAAALNAALGTGAYARDTQDTSGTSTSASYTATITGGTACGVTFVAPASGAVEITVVAQMSNNTAGSYCFTAPQVRTGSSIGSGTLILTADDAKAATMNGTLAWRQDATTPVTGLTPGDTYNAQALVKVSANTGTFVRKILMVRPA